MPEQQLLMIVTPAEIRDDVVDTLIALEVVSGFSVVTIAGYSREHSEYDLAEQVEGSRQLFRFEVQHREEDRQALFEALEPVCSVANCRYLIVPVLFQGHFGILRK